MALNELQQRLIGETYPHNHRYEFDDQFNLTPIGQIVRRDKLWDDKFANIIKESKSFLSLGSNKGYFCFKMNKSGLRTVGVEPSKSQVDLCSDIVKYFKLENISFIRSEFNKKVLAQLDGYDLVYMGNMYHYIFNQFHNHQPIWELLYKIANKYIIFENPLDNTDTVVQGNFFNPDRPKNLWCPDVQREYTKEKFLQVVSQYFTIQDLGVSATSSTRNLYLLTRKGPGLRKREDFKLLNNLSKVEIYSAIDNITNRKVCVKFLGTKEKPINQFLFYEEHLRGLCILNKRGLSPEIYAIILNQDKEIIGYSMELIEDFNLGRWIKFLKEKPLEERKQIVIKILNSQVILLQNNLVMTDITISNTIGNDDKFYIIDAESWQSIEHMQYLIDKDSVYDLALIIVKLERIILRLLSLRGYTKSGIEKCFQQMTCKSLISENFYLDLIKVIERYQDE